MVLHYNITKFTCSSQNIDDMLHNKETKRNCNADLLSLSTMVTVVLLWLPSWIPLGNELEMIIRWNFSFFSKTESLNIPISIGNVVCPAGIVTLYGILKS